MMNRRRLILGGLGLAAIAGAGAWGIGHWAAKAEIAAVLRRRLNFLKLDEDGVRAFAKDQTDAMFAKKIPTLNRLRYHLQASADPMFKRFLRSNDNRSRTVRFEDNLVSTFLLSSDFFTGGADESRIVKYVVYYDPQRPCQNPFARPALDPGSAA